MEETIKAKISDVPMDLRTRLRGRYNALISECYHCSSKIGVFFGTLIGFSDSNSGLMQIHECQRCFRVQRFHVKSIGMLETLLLALTVTRTSKEPSNDR